MIKRKYIFGTYQRMRPFIWIVVHLFILQGNMHAQTLEKLPSYSQLRSCDLLFCLSVEGNAITDVTCGAEGMKIDHVGIYHQGHVFEAVPQGGVRRTPVDSFLLHNRHQVVVGRVSVPFSKRKTISRARQCIGLPYDSLFMPDMKAVYCSELVLYAFCDKQGKPLFQPIGMTFRDSSGEIPSYWTDFYRQLGMCVPEDEPGSNPGELSRRKAVKLLYRTF